MKLYCKRGGFCDPVNLGISDTGTQVRVCAKGGEILFSRPALGLRPGDILRGLPGAVWPADLVTLHSWTAPAELEGARS